MKNYISAKIKIGKNVKIGHNVIIEGQGRIKDDVEIGHGVNIEGNVSIDSGTRIDNNVIIRGNVKIGQNNWIYPNCIIGTGPQHLKYLEKSKKFTKARGEIIIGNNNIIREFTTIHLPTKNPITKIGSFCYIMAYCHIAHDCIIHDGVIFANQATLGGHVEVFSKVNIGLGVEIHQFCKIGSYSMVGMGNSIIKDVLPFSVIINGKFSKINEIGLERNKISKKDIKGIKQYYKSNNYLTKKPILWYEKEISLLLKTSERKSYLPDLN